MFFFILHILFLVKNQAQIRYNTCINNSYDIGGFFFPSSNWCSVCFLASIAVRRLIGVTEVKKTGSSYGNVESKKEN